MSTLKEDILELVGSSKKLTLDRNMIAKKLNLSGALEIAELDKAIDELENSAELFRGRGNRYMNREQNGISVGVLHVNRRGTGYVDREGKASIMISPGRLNGALDGDTVAARTEENGRYNIYEAVNGSVVKILKRSKDYLVGTYIDTPYGPRFWPDDEKFRGLSISMQEPEGFTALPGMKAKAKIDTYGNPMELTFVKTIGFKDDPGVDLLTVLLDHGIDPEFPEAVMQQAEAIPQEVLEEEKEGRTDLTGELTITIDGDDSKDFDDAVAVTKTDDGWILKVSIADVTHYVTEGSPLDLEAAKRGTSSYVIDKVVPMLPQLLSNGICSLNPHVVRLTNTCEMNISRNGVVTDFKVYPSYICSAERMTYRNVNKMLAGDEETLKQYAHIAQLVQDLTDCADAIRSQRVASGAIDFASDEAEIRVDETGKPIYVGPAERGHGEKVIEDCMIAANVSVAKLMNHNQFPCIYRIHAEPSVKRLTNYAHMAYMLGQPFNVKNAVSPKEIQRYLKSKENTEEFNVLSAQMLRCMAKAVYDHTCQGHFGLAESEYLHFTSPIRRYPDLIVHRMLRRYYYEGDFTHRKADEEHVREYSISSSEREREADAAEFECEDMKKAEYMKDKVGMVFEGIITSVKNYGFYVTLPDTIEGIVRVDSLFDGYYRYDEGRLALINDHTKTMYRIGDKISVRVLSASKETRTIEFGVVRTAGGKPRDKAEQAKKGRKTRSRAARKAEQYGIQLKTDKRGRRSASGRKTNGRGKKR